jgi:hypothetical protein
MTRSWHIERVSLAPSCSKTDERLPNFLERVASHPPAALCAVHFLAVSCVGLIAKIQFVGEQCCCSSRGRARRNILEREFQTLQVALPDVAKEVNVSRFVEAHREEFTALLPARFLRKPDPQIELVLTLIALDQVSTAGLHLLSLSNACNSAFTGLSLVRLDTIRASSWHIACLRYAAHLWTYSFGVGSVPIPPLKECQLQALAARLELEYVQRKRKLRLNRNGLTARVERVTIAGPGEPVYLKGLEKPPLTLPQYDVIKALLDAGERGLSKDEMDYRSKHGDARKILKRLANSDADWEAVIQFPGKACGGYRIR